MSLLGCSKDARWLVSSLRPRDNELFGLLRHRTLEYCVNLTMGLTILGCRVPQKPS